MSPAEDFTSPAWPVPLEKRAASWSGALRGAEGTACSRCLHRLRRHRCGPARPASPPLLPSNAAASAHPAGRCCFCSPGGALLQIVAEDAAASEVLEADEFDAATQDSLHYAREVVSKAVDSAAARVRPRPVAGLLLSPGHARPSAALQGVALQGALLPLPMPPPVRVSAGTNGHKCSACHPPARWTSPACFSRPWPPKAEPRVGLPGLVGMTSSLPGGRHSARPGLRLTAPWLRHAGRQTSAPDVPLLP